MNLAEAAFSLPPAFVNHALSGLIVVGSDENNRRVVLPTRDGLKNSVLTAGLES